MPIANDNHEGNHLEVAFVIYGNSLLAMVLEFGTEFVKKNMPFSGLIFGNPCFVFKLFILLQSFSKKEKIADVAQLVEQLICNQLVGGSNPSIGSEFRIKTEHRSQFEIVH